VFTDKQGRSETHIFDNSGSTVSVLNSNGTKGSTASKGGKVTVDNSSATEEDGYYQYLGTTSLKVENPTSEDNTAFFTGENRTFCIALNIYYNNSSTPEFHYQNFSADTYAYQQVSLSVTPEKTNEVVNYIAFAFVYGYNENEMLDIASDNNLNGKIRIW
jgi:hypothetical protein